MRTFPATPGHLVLFLRRCGRLKYHGLIRSPLNASHDYSSGSTPCRQANTNVVYKTPPNVPAVNRNALNSLLKNTIAPFYGKGGGSAISNACISPGINKTPDAYLMHCLSATPYGTQHEDDDGSVPLHPANPGTGSGNVQTHHTRKRCNSEYAKMQFAGLRFSFGARFCLQDAGIREVPPQLA